MLFQEESIIYVHVFVFFMGELDIISMAISTSERMTYLDLGKKLPNVVQTYMNFFQKLIENICLFWQN